MDDNIKNNEIVIQTAKNRVFKTFTYNTLINDRTELASNYFCTIRNLLKPNYKNDRKLSHDENEHLRQKFVNKLYDIRECILSLKTNTDIIDFILNLKEKLKESNIDYNDLDDVFKEEISFDDVNKLFRMFVNEKDNIPTISNNCVTKNNTNKLFVINNKLFVINQLYSGITLSKVNDKRLVKDSDEVYLTRFNDEVYMFESRHLANKFLDINNSLLQKLNLGISPNLIVTPDVKNIIIDTKSLHDLNINYIEYGKSLSKKEKQNHILSLISSIINLTEALNISPLNFSLTSKDSNGLSFAIGSRGTKSYNHYDEKDNIIIIPKNVGSCNIAFEWSKVLYNYINNALNKLKEDNDLVNYRKLKDALFNLYKKMDYVPPKIDNYIKAVSEDPNYITLNRTLTRRGEKEISAEYIAKCYLTNKSLDPVLNKLKEKYGPDDIINCYAFLINIPLENIEDHLPYSKYYKDYKRLLEKEKQGLIKEIHLNNGTYFANALCSYIKDNIKELGIENNYLLEHVDKIKYNDALAFPVREERENISKGFKELFDCLKEMNIFQEYDIDNINLDRIEQKVQNIEETIR